MVATAFVGLVPVAGSRVGVVQRVVSVRACSVRSTARKCVLIKCSNSEQDVPEKAAPLENVAAPDGLMPEEYMTAMTVGALALLMAGMAPESADAAEALKAIMKTKPATLMHPAAMWILFGVCGYTGYLGWQVRELRSTDDADKKKALAKEKPGSKHFKMSSALMAIMTLVTFEGMANTFSRANKLFPGPHLYAGLGLVATMSVMAALVPAMQGGSKPARDAHLAAGALATGLFAWQAKTGMDIVAKILGWA